MMNSNVMRAVTLAATIATVAFWNSDAAAQASCCTHQGGSVACPSGLPPGSQSVEFAPGGTVWVTPQGQQVFVPQATFPPCTTTTPTTPPVQPPVKPPVQPPTTPPVDTPKTPPVEPPKTPPVQPPPRTQERPPVAPPTDGGRSNEDRARRLIEPPPTPPIIVVPPPSDDGKTTDDIIQRMGRELREQTPTTQERPPVTPPVTPPVPPTYGPPDQPPTYGPGEPPVYGPEDPTTKRRRRELPPPCCGIANKLITFPITTDPMQPPPQLEAPRDPAVGGMQVYLHDGAFFTNALDLRVPKYFYDMQWSRHYRSDANFREGGLLGHGWDFFFNKRVVPWGREYKNGLLAEHVGEDIPKLTYYSGTGRAEVYSADPGAGGHSELRTVENFDMEFHAYVTTYVSPPGAFHEIERYVLLPNEPHAFAEHKNVEKSERIFYVLREKDGTRYVFNCRGQLIYIVSRNDSPAKRIRVELHYREPLNPLTQNPMLYEIVPAVGKPWQVDTIDIGEGVVNTNLRCQPVSDTLRIRRIQRLRSETTTITYEYRNSGDGPDLASVRKTAADPKSKFPVNARQWQYTYNGGHQLTDIKNPNECAKGDSGKPYLHNSYAGDRMQSQTLGGEYVLKPDVVISRAPVVTSVPMTFSFQYGGGTTSVTNAKEHKREYRLENVSGYPVVAAVTVSDSNAENGGPWTTQYKHNGFTQVEEITYPAGNGVTFEYEGADQAVKLGPIRDWVEKDWTYEHNLAKGNLRSVTKHEAGMGKTVTRAPGATYSGPSTSTTRNKYEELYNLLAENIDALGNETKFDYTDYYTPKHRGNPMSMEDPPVLQPDDAGTLLGRPITEFAYDTFAQRESVKEGDKQIAKYEYNAARYIRHVDYQGGSFENLRYDALANIIQRETQDGAVEYGRDPFGQLRRKTIDPKGLALVTAYEYDNNGNTIEVGTEVKDTFGSATDLAKRSGLAPVATYWQLDKTIYDLFDREQSRTLSGQGLSYQTVSGYDAAGDLAFTIEPPRDGWEAFKTTFRHDARHLVRETVTAAGTDAARTLRRDFDDNGDLALIETGSDTGIARNTMHYNGLGRIDLATDPLGAQRNFVYDAAGNLVEQTVTGSAGVLQHASYTYDAYQHVIRRAIDVLTSGAQEVSKWYYSERLLLARTLSPNGSGMKYDYDTQDRVEYVTDALDDKTKNIYNGAGNLVRVEVTTTERSRAGTTGNYVESPKTDTTSTIYDSAARVVEVTTPAGRERRFLDSLGRARGTVSVTDQLTTMLYDGLGRQTDLKNGLMATHKSYTLGGLIKQSAGPEGNYWFTYDARGRMLSRVDQDTGAATTYHYDGHTIETTDGNGTKVRTTYNGGTLPIDVAVTPSNRIKIPPRNQTPASVAASIQAGPGAPDGRTFDIARGVTREHFDYDELGRVTKARSGGESGAGNTGDSSTVVRVYDGLGRLVEEQQGVFATTRTVKYRYADDFSWSEVIYPEIASSARYRFHMDKLARIDKVTLDDKYVAGFAYTGLDHLATRSLANGVGTHFVYDASSRLNDLAIIRSARPSESKTLWRAFGTYDAVGFATVTEFTPGGGADQGDVAAVTYLKRDPLGRVLSSTTGLLTSAEVQGAVKAPVGSAAPASKGAKPTIEPLRVTGILSEMSGSFNVYDGAKLAVTAEYGGVALPRQGAKGFVADVLGCLGGPVSCVQGVPIRSLRVDRFGYGPRQRVDRVTTSGAFDARTQQFPDGVDAVAKIVQVRSGASDLFTAGARTPPTAEVFEYDRNGNLIDDGRFHYAYDFKNRPVLVEDTWAPNGYDERMGIFYDPFDRRVAITGNRTNRSKQAGGGMQFDNPWTPSSTRLIYDGDQVIAEVWSNPDASEPVATLIATYFHGARQGELLRMDARPTDQPKSQLKTFYVHEDLNGVIRFVSDINGELHGIDNETPLTVGKTNAEIVPGDRNVIAASVISDKTYQSSGIRMPYIASGMRIDGFAGLTWRDDVKQPVINWRSAANYVRDTERRVIADQKLVQQNQMQATVGVLVALPIGAAVAIPATAAEITWSSIGYAAFTGGSIQTGIGYVSAWANGLPYSPGDAGLDFFQGATFAVGGKVIGAMGLSRSATLGAELAMLSNTGFVWGVARGGRFDLDNMFGNIVMTVAMSGVGSGVGWVSSKVKRALSNVIYDAAESTPALAAAVKEEVASAASPSAVCLRSRSFVAGTQVLTANGPKSIETVELGDNVWSRDFATGQEGFKRVTNALRSRNAEFIVLTYRSSAAEPSISASAHGGNLLAVHQGQENGYASDAGLHRSEIVGTATHPFWSVTRSEWIAMGNLAVGEKLLLSSGATVEIIGVERRRTRAGDTLPTFNFEVESWHSYFVGASKGGEFVWVHNARCSGDFIAGEFAGDRPHDFRPSTWEVLRQRYPWAFDSFGKIREGWLRDKNGKRYWGPLYNARHEFVQAEFKNVLEVMFANATTPAEQLDVLSFWKGRPVSARNIKQAIREIYMDWYNDPDRLWMGPTRENIEKGSTIKAGRQNILDDPRVIDRRNLPHIHFLD